MNEANHPKPDDQSEQSAPETKADNNAETKPDKKPEAAAETKTVDDGTPRCDLCGSPMYEWHCRIVCGSCGYQRDCSDP